MKLIRYYSNNSGGSWWLTDKDWAKLKKAGWQIYGFDSFVYEKGKYTWNKNGYPKRKGAIPKTGPYAFKYFPDMETAKYEFAGITDQDVDAEGCSCCGQPHEFRVEQRAPKATQ